MLDLNRFMLMESTSFQRFVAQGGELPETAVDVTAGPASDAARRGASIVLDKSGVAVVSILGMTNKRMRAQPYLASYIDAIWAVESAAADPKVKTILLKVDSPGGYVDGVSDAADAVAKAAKTKRVVAQVDGLMASAAYWIGSQANEIYAGRMDEVGSIGVLAIYYDYSKAFEKNGVKAEVFSTGKYKWTGAVGTAMTDEQRSYVQASVDRIGDAFVADVAAGRRRAVDDIAKLADGRVFGADAAVANGLIDGIQSFPDTMRILKEDATSQRARDERLRRARLEAVEKAVRK